MSTEPRTVNLPTADYGAVTLPCPEWCAGHADHRSDTRRADLAHSGPDVVLAFRGQQVSYACLDQAPYADTGPRHPQISLSLIGIALDAGGVYEFAAALDRYADQLRDLADQLDTITAEGSE
ncbi:hypothetical protein ABZV34_16570 [Streptomyces sp. NPDC005195]|uniref:DUF6907 domain-containing protein n=1 Tax=Streptomyces sp. NPDC005195 TaxID=3154561 RepID=UPI0033A52284